MTHRTTLLAKLDLAIDVDHDHDVALDRALQCARARSSDDGVRDAQRHDDAPMRQRAMGKRARANALREARDCASGGTEFDANDDDE